MLIYTLVAPQSNFPKDTLLGLPGITLDRLVQFESQVSDPGLSLRDKLTFTRSLLESITGLEMSRWFQKKTSFILNVPEKELLSKPSGHAGRMNVMDQDSSANLDQLFDESV